MKKKKEHVTFGTDGAQIRDLEVKLAAFYTEFRYESNGKGPGPQKPDKK